MESNFVPSCLFLDKEIEKSTKERHLGCRRGEARQIVAVKLLTTGDIWTHAVNSFSQPIEHVKLHLRFAHGVKKEQKHGFHPGLANPGLLLTNRRVALLEFYFLCCE